MLQAISVRTQRQNSDSDVSCMGFIDDVINVLAGRMRYARRAEEMVRSEKHEVKRGTSKEDTGE